MKLNNIEVDKYRLVKDGKYLNFDLACYSDSSYRNNGIFIVPYKNIKLYCIVSDGLGWDHVSVSVICVKKPRTPFWDEMVFIKDLFWSDSETVIQYHPEKTSYVNIHNYCLHLWRNQSAVVELPPIITV